ncbi:hypothetical protein IP88_04925 [alpha proteobacterium AAP81b]|nr:hypothetical protein IP88_04925 [alpha proteobacterium AAP81b]
MTDPPFLAGHLLLSMPGIGDPRFERVVIAMCLHDADGAFGLVVNSPSPLSVRTLMAQQGIDGSRVPAEVPVLAGGPVEPQRGFVLHSLDYEGQSTIFVDGKWAMTATLDVLKAIAAGRGPEQWIAAMGYTGWGPGQLDGELLRHGWQVAPGDPALVFDSPWAERWPAAYGGIGINVGQLSATPGRA